MSTDRRMFAGAGNTPVARVEHPRRPGLCGPTRYTWWLTHENLERLFDTSRVSQPFYGSVLTLYAQVPRRPAWIDGIGNAGRVSWNVAAESAVEIEHAREAIDATARQGGTIFTNGSAGPRHAALLAASGRPATALRGKGLPCDATPIDLLLLPWENPSCAKLADAARQQGLASISLAQGMNQVGARPHPLDLPTAPVCVTCQSTVLRSAARVGS